jgi:hypothetical protein
VVDQLKPETVRRAGRALFGTSWRYAFEVTFGISGRKLRRLVNGDEPVHPATEAKIMSALLERRAELAATLAEMGR